jgi:hypothetical protein
LPSLQKGWKAKRDLFHNGLVGSFVRYSKLLFDICLSGVETISASSFTKAMKQVIFGDHEHFLQAQWML